MLEIPDAVKEKIYTFAIDHFKKYKDKRDPYDLRVYDWLRHYNSIPSTERNGEAIQKWEHNMFVPYTFGVVETIKPRVKASTFNDPRFLSVEAVDKAFITHEKSITDWYLFKLDGLNFKEEMSHATGDALIYPCAWEKVHLVKKGKEVTVTTIPVDFFDIWVDFAYRKELKDCYHRIESNMNKIRALEREGKYENVDKLEGTTFPLDIPEKKSQVESLFLSTADYGIDKTKEADEVKSLQTIELLEWWGKYDYNDDGIDENVLVTIGNREIGLRIDEWKDRVPFFPIRTGKNTRVIYGRPLPQQLEMLQEELNEQRSKRYDLLDRVLQLMFKARRTATIDWDTLFSAPDNVLLMDDIEEDLAIIKLEPPTAAVYQEEEITKSDITFVSGVQDYSKAGVSGTATGINAILSEAATRFRNLVDDIVEDMLDLVSYIFLMIKKYSTETESFKIHNSQKWETITAAEKKGNYRVKAEVSNITTTNKELKMQLFINLLNIIGRMEGMVNIKEFIRMILHYADIKNVDEILQETPAGEEKKKSKKVREELLKRKKAEVEPGMEGVTARTIEQSLLPAPVAPATPQTVQNPLLSAIISPMTGGQPTGGI